MMNLSILNNWGFMRSLRLVLGLSILIQSVVIKDWGMGTMGFLFTLLPILNIGCCGAGGCATRPIKSNVNSTKDTSYEEVV